MPNDKISLFGVAGNPIVHSQSPQLFRYAYRFYKKKKNGENAAYIRLITDSAHEVLDLAKQIPLKGINITSPYKEKIAEFVTLHEEAAVIKSINTLKINGDTVDGYNTDIYGVAEMLKKIKFYEYASVFLIGAGGAAKAILYYFNSKNIKCYICNRTISKAAVFCDQFNCIAISYGDMGKYKKGKSIFFVTTPPDIIPFDETIIAKNDLIVSVHYVKDVFKEIARKRHVHYIDGEKWLIKQAQKAFEIFTGKIPQFKNYSFKSHDHLYKLKKSIVLIGFMGAGKTAIGKLLAEKLARQFIDTDESIEKQLNRSISSIFGSNGEKYFRNIESQVLQKALIHKNSVISAGGGIVAVFKNIREMKKHSFAIWLYCEPQTAFNRIIGQGNRPLADSSDFNDFKRLHEMRKILYAQSCDCCIDTTKRTAMEVAERLYYEIQKGLQRIV